MILEGEKEIENEIPSNNEKMRNFFSDFRSLIKN